MEGNPENQDGAAVEQPLDESVQPAAQPAAGESGRQEPDPTALARGMNDFMRGEMGAPVATSKPAEADASGESAPTDAGDVEAEGEPPPRGPDGKFLPRRGVPKAVEEAQARIADLERQLADRDPSKVAEREALEALEQSERADAERYRELNDLPDDHPKLAEGDNWSFLQEYKRVLALSPKAAKQHRALYEIEREQLTKGQEKFRTGVRDEILTGAREFGVDPKNWMGDEGDATWLSMTRDAVAAKTAPLQARIAELERELHSARTVGPNGLGSVRAPAAAGRSSAGPPPRTMNDILRYG